MSFPNPFAGSGTWFKGCLHVHSTASDGDLTPREVINWYRQRGYHFLAFADHGVLSEPESYGASFITLSGIELEGIDPQSGLYHIVGLGAQSPVEPLALRPLPLQEAVNRLRAAGALVVHAHPYWSGQMSKDLLGLTGSLALEIYNGGCEVDDAKGFSTVHWDDLLSAGCRLWGVAVDDAHWRAGSRDAGLGWVWVKAADLNQAAILQALEEGSFYASSGPRILDMYLDEHDDWAHVRCTPVAAIDFVGPGPASRRVTAPAGGTLEKASYRLRRGQRYLRVACQDLQGLWAWTNPLYLDSRWA
jgi:hypothetical protein